MYEKIKLLKFFLIILFLVPVASMATEFIFLIGEFICQRKLLSTKIK